LVPPNWKSRLAHWFRPAPAPLANRRPERIANAPAKPSAILKMLALLALACTLQSSPAGCQQRPPNMSIPVPNWNEPPAEAQTEAAQADARGPRTPGPGEIAFSFNLAESARSTSAGVYDPQGRLVRMLWSARPYGAGKHYDLWDGKDDYGNPALPASYTIKVLAANVHYDWDGVIGVTEDSLTGPNNWDGAGSFPSSLAFIKGKAYVAGGYNESRLEAFVFDEKTPYTVAPLNLALQSGGQFEYAASDGNRVYFASLMWWRNTTNAVVAFDPDGQPYSFPEGTVMPPGLTRPAYFSNVNIRPVLALKGVRGVDLGLNTTSAITGLAVQRNGNLLASSHGARGGGSHPIDSLDSISLWDKTTGASAGTITGIPSPQKMAFDLHGDLWVIEGGPVSEWHWETGSRLARIRGVGGKNEITEPIQGLQNPVDVAVNPVNGHLFVADGGSSQQVKEFDPDTGKQLAAIGTLGGYGQGENCNATLTPTKFWLDFNGRGTGVTQPWIAVDEAGDLWVGDYTANRMLQFHRGAYVRQIAMGRWLSQLSVPRNNPTRVFGGINGLLEYQVNYSVPLQPGDPTAPGGNNSWRAVRNWYPCFLEAERGRQDSKTVQLISTETLANGITYGSIMYHGGPFADKTALVQLPESGKITAVNNRFPGNGRAWFDASGSFYHMTRTGPPAAPLYSLKRFAITGFDAQSFPQWDNGTPIGSLAPDFAKGNPVPSCWTDGCDFTPSSGGIVPIYTARYPAAPSSPDTPIFHLGGLPVQGSSLAWQTQPERQIKYPDGRGTYTTLTHETNTSNGAHAIGHDIFAGYNGNWQQFSCQYFHYRDDGLLVGQFGWRGTGDYPFMGTAAGYPDARLGQPLAPGVCGNNMMFKVVQVGKDYYIYNADEGYRAGLHRWHIYRLDSIHELAGEGALGASVQLSPIESQGTATRPTPPSAYSQ
jgi:DNA-binding beta-propeller fold protein YncE